MKNTATETTEPNNNGVNIWKFVLSVPGPNEIYIPSGFRVLSVAQQNRGLVMWCEVRPDAPQKLALFDVVGTGSYFQDRPRQYCGTVVMSEGDFVWHVFLRPDLCQPPIPCTSDPSVPSVENPPPRQMFQRFELVPARDLKIGDVVIWSGGNFGGMVQARVVIRSIVYGDFHQAELANEPHPPIYYHNTPGTLIMRVVA